MRFGDGLRRLKSSGIGLGPPIAIDFGTHSLKLLQVAAGESPSLIAAAALPTPEEFLSDPQGRFEFQAEALGRLVRSSGFRGRRAVCAIPATQTLCKLLRVQKTEGVPISTVVGTALAAQLGCDPAALVHRHIEVGDPAKSGGKMEVICLAAGRDRVERLMGTIKAAKLEPVGMHNEFAAVLSGLVRISGGITEGAATLVLDIGFGSTKVMITHGLNLAFAKTVEIGGRHMDEHLSRLLKVEAAEAARIRKNMKSMTAEAGAVEEPGGGVATQTRSRTVGPKPDLSEPLEILTDEIQMCLRYHDSAFTSARVSRVIFVGGEARQRALGEHIARVLRLPAQVADPLAQVARSGKEPMVGVDFSDPQPGWALPLGLCMSRTDL